MKRLTRKGMISGAAALFAVLLVASVVAYSTFINVAPHFFTTNECLECHFTIPNPDDPRPLRFNKPIGELCKRCHEDLSPLSHAVGIVPSMKMPEGMPLDGIGLFTCTTCHDPHMNRLDKKGNKTFFLRGDKKGKAFCVLCHEDKEHKGELTIFAFTGKVTHRRTISLSHGFESFSGYDKDADLDPLSEMCSGCHAEDEEVVDIADIKKENMWSIGSGIGHSHPIGIDYDRAAWGNKELISMDDVDPRIVFFDGKIGCGSCHNLYAPGGGVSLVIGDRDNYQDLCFGCHNL